jgi:hypothetical protein
MTKSIFRTLAKIGFLTIILTPLTAGAWGRRGHQIVGETASVLVSQGPNAEFLRNQSFNMGYYANVPDFIWKRPETYGFEKAQHFMDMEVFNREFAKHPEVAKPFEMSRKDFEAKFPDIPADAGRAFWRIREFYADLENTTAKLRALKEPTGHTRQKLQERWLMIAGLMAHYVGDLSMPLHVSENYDGLLTKQSGVHSQFEEISVDEIYPSILCEVDREAKKEWPAFTKRNKDRSVVELLEDLATRSNKQIDKVLKMDKKNDRKNLKNYAEAFRPLIRQQLVDGSLTLAELYRRQVGWTFDNNKFYFFANEPAYIMPGDLHEDLNPAPRKK